jgi:hypothetical protein
MSRVAFNASILDRMGKAVEKVRERLLRAAGALREARVPYAVIGGNAVAAWVATVDESAVRNTRDVDMLIDRAHLERAKAALEGVGFVYRHAAGVHLFLDGPEARARDGVHIVFAGEKVRPDYETPAPDVAESVDFPEGIGVLSLDALIRMKLTSFRWVDRTHLLDLIGAGLIREENPPDLPPVLKERLRQVFENREED